MNFNLNQLVEIIFFPFVEIRAIPQENNNQFELYERTENNIFNIRLRILRMRLVVRHVIHY